MHFNHSEKLAVFMVATAFEYGRFHLHEWELHSATEVYTMLNNAPMTVGYKFVITSCASRASANRPTGTK